MHIRKNINNRGSIAVETAILLPLFVIGILSIGYLLKFCMVAEGAHHALADETHRIAAEAAALNPFPAAFQRDLTQRTERESRGEIRNAAVSRFLYRVPGVSKSGRAYGELIAVSLSFETPLKLPRLFRGDIAGERTVLCRAFVGLSNAGAVLPFSEMQQAENGGMVWVFPRFGERYHAEHCSYIENQPREVLLSASIRRAYAPCKLCKPDSERDGTLVYCFPASGRAYHIDSCTIVDRYVIEIAKEDAERQGYTPCAKCGGG